MSKIEIHSFQVHYGESAEKSYSICIFRDANNKNSHRDDGLCWITFTSEQAERLMSFLWGEGVKPDQFKDMFRNLINKLGQP